MEVESWGDVSLRKRKNRGGGRGIYPRHKVVFLLARRKDEKRKYMTSQIKQRNTISARKDNGTHNTNKRENHVSGRQQSKTQ